MVLFAARSRCIFFVMRTEPIQVLSETELLGHKFTVYGTAENPLFLAKEVAECIEYDQSSVNKLVNLVDDDEKVRNNLPTPGGNRRSMSDLNKLINDELKPRKIRLVIVQMGIDLNCGMIKAMDEMILFAFSFAAELERELIQERTKSALEVKKKQIEENGYFISKAGNKCTSLGGTTSGQAKGGKANGEKRRKEAMNDEKNNMIAAMLEGCNTPQDIDKVVERLNARGILTKTGLPFTRNRLTALRTKINRRTEYIQSML